MAPRNRPDRTDRTDGLTPEELVAEGAVPDPGSASLSEHEVQETRTDVSPEELSAETTDTPDDETVEDVTAADAAVESYRRNNPEAEQAEGEGE